MLRRLGIKFPGSDAEKPSPHLLVRHSPRVRVTLGNCAGEGLSFSNLVVYVRERVYLAHKGRIAKLGAQCTYFA